MQFIYLILYFKRQFSFLNDVWFISDTYRAFQGEIGLHFVVVLVTCMIPRYSLTPVNEELNKHYQIGTSYMKNICNQIINCATN